MENRTFQKIIKDLVKKKEYFNIYPALTHRIIGINNDGFRIDDDIQTFRENIHCFSNDYFFLKQKEEQIKGHLLDSINNEQFFHTYKESLSDLMWVIVGYY